MGEYFESEPERRRYAVRRVIEERMSVVATAAEVGRSERWLHKWLRRYEQEGEEGLRDRSRAPHRSPTATPQEVMERVLAVRRDLEAHPFANRGAEAIRYELIREGFSPVPSRATIERILRRAGVTRPEPRHGSKKDPRPLPEVSAPGIWAQIDWVGPRWLRRRVRFSSLHTVDVGGGGAAAAQYPDERLARTVPFLGDRAWPTLGIPLHLQADGAFVALPPGAPPRPFNPFVLICLLFGVEVVISPPEEFGWQNHIESFNGLWQARTIRRHHYASPEEVSEDSDRFSHYFLWERPHPQLQVATHGTRYPGELIARHRDRVRFPPEGFSAADYEDRAGQLRLPLARGRLSYLCRVGLGGVIEVARTPFFVPTSTEGLVVCATVLTSRSQLVVRLGGEVIATHRFPIEEKTIAPYYPIARRGLFYDIPA